MLLCLYKSRNIHNIHTAYSKEQLLATDPISQESLKKRFIFSASKLPSPFQRALAQVDHEDVRNVQRIFSVSQLVEITTVIPYFIYIDISHRINGNGIFTEFTDYFSIQIKYSCL